MVVRAAGRDARRAIVGAERARAERLLIAHLRSLSGLRSSSVGVFVAHDGEPDLSPLVDWLWHHDRTVALPVIDDHSGAAMTFRPWLHGETLQPGRYGIAVPAPAEPIEPATLLVPMTGFDPAGNRIGRGGGFYDRYLARYTKNVIGVAFEAQRFAEVPTERHDVALPVVVTDLGVRWVEGDKVGPIPTDSSRNR